MRINDANLSAHPAPPPARARAQRARFPPLLSHQLSRPIHGIAVSCNSYLAEGHHGCTAADPRNSGGAAGGRSGPEQRPRPVQAMTALLGVGCRASAKADPAGRLSIN